MIVALLLAAGSSTRMGKPKLTLPVAGRPMLAKVLGIFRHTNVDKVVVVLGANAAEIMERIRFEDEEVVVNPGYRKGMSGSLKVAIAAAGRDAEAVLVALADKPFLSPKTVDKLIGVYSATHSPIVVPVYGGVRGHPVLIGRSFFPQIMRLNGDVGAKAILEAAGGTVLEVLVNDPGVVIDINTPSDYRRLSKAYKGTTRNKPNRNPKSPS